MTPEEKAKDLFDKFYIQVMEYNEDIQTSILARRCAIQCVQEILTSTFLAHEYWELVKIEIERL